MGRKAMGISTLGAADDQQEAEFRSRTFVNFKSSDFKA